MADNRIRNIIQDLAIDTNSTVSITDPTENSVQSINLAEALLNGVDATNSISDEFRLVSKTGGIYRINSGYTAIASYDFDGDVSNKLFCYYRVTNDSGPARDLVELEGLYSNSMGRTTYSLSLENNANGVTFPAAEQFSSYPTAPIILFFSNNPNILPDGSNLNDPNYELVSIEELWYEALGVSEAYTDERIANLEIPAGWVSVHLDTDEKPTDAGEAGTIYVQPNGIMWVWSETKSDYVKINGLTDISGLVQKTTQSNVAYTTDGIGAQTVTPVLTEATANSIVKRDSSGNILVPGEVDWESNNAVSASQVLEALPQNAVGIFESIGTLDPTSANGTPICRLELDNLLFLIVKNNNYGSIRVLSLDGSAQTITSTSNQYYDGASNQIRNAKFATISGETYYEFDNDVGYSGGTIGNITMQVVETGKIYKISNAATSTTKSTSSADKYTLAVLPMESVPVKYNGLISKNNLPADTLYASDLDAVPTKDSAGLVASGGVWSELQLLKPNVVAEKLTSRNFTSIGTPPLYTISIRGNTLDKYTVALTPIKTTSEDLDPLTVSSPSTAIYEWSLLEEALNMIPDEQLETAITTLGFASLDELKEFTNTTSYALNVLDVHLEKGFIVSIMPSGTDPSLATTKHYWSRQYLPGPNMEWLVTDKDGNVPDGFDKYAKLSDVPDMTANNDELKLYVDEKVQSAVSSFEVVTEYGIPYTSGDTVVLSQKASAIVMAVVKTPDGFSEGRVKCHTDADGRLVLEETIDGGSSIDVTYFVGVGDVSGGGSGVDIDLIVSRVMSMIDTSAIEQSVANTIGINRVEYVSATRELRVYTNDGSFKTATLPLASTILDGLMSKEDRQQISTISSRVSSLELGGVWVRTFATYEDMASTYPNLDVSAESFTVNDYVYVETDSQKENETTSYIVDGTNHLVFRRREDTPIRTADGEELGVVKSGGDATITAGVITVPQLTTLQAKNDEQDTTLTNSLIGTVQSFKVGSPLGLLEGEVVENANYIQGYTGALYMTDAEGMSPGEVRGTISYSPWSNGDGYGTQLFHNIDTDEIWTRRSIAMEWQPWKRLMYQDNVCNPNLIINGDFMHNPVNQRGLTSYFTETLGTAYTLDMVRSRQGTLEVLTDHINYVVSTRDGTDTGWPEINTPIEGIFRNGETYTISAIIRLNSYEGSSPMFRIADLSTNSTIPGGALQFDKIGEKMLLSYTVTLVGDYNSLNVGFLTLNDGISRFDIDIYAWKLERGSASTLANEPVENYGVKLAKCQRYFINLSYPSTPGINDIPIATLHGQLYNGVYGLLPTPVTMCTKPTITFINSTSNVKLSGIFPDGYKLVDVDSAAFNVFDAQANGIYIGIVNNPDITFVQGNTYYLLGYDGTNVQLSAELKNNG